MTVDIKDLVTQVTMITLKAKALAADAEVLHQTLRQAVAEAMPTQDADVTTMESCRCPPNQRVTAAVQGHPRRTKCRLCGKEHE